MRIKAIKVYKVSGNSNEILSVFVFEDVYLEFCPLPSFGAWLMLPVSDELAARREKRGGYTMPLSKIDFVDRGVMELTPGEARKVLAAPPGTEIVITRKGWGRQWKNRLRKEAP